jgi:hypothetical protein
LYQQAPYRDTRETPKRSEDAWGHPLVGMHKHASAVALIALFCATEIISVDASPRRQNGGYA